MIIDALRQFVVDALQKLLYMLVLSAGFSAALTASIMFLCYAFSDEFRTFADHYYWQSTLVFVGVGAIGACFVPLIRYIEYRWPHVIY